MQAYSKTTFYSDKKRTCSEFTLLEKPFDIFIDPQGERFEDWLGSEFVAAVEFDVLHKFRGVHNRKNRWQSRV